MQSVIPIDLTPLANVGAVGIILAWHMIRIVPRLDRIERAIDRQTRAHMLDILSRPGVSEPVRRQAQALNREIKDRYSLNTAEDVDEAP